MNAHAQNDPLLAVEGLKVYFGTKKRPVRAVNGVDLTIGKGETLGLVGESGCGKTTLGRAILGIQKPTDGRIKFAGADMAEMSRAERSGFRRKVQMVFQDPYGSLNPRMSVGRAIDEVLNVNHRGTKQERRSRAEELFKSVGLDPAYLNRYPHEFSGGQRQRIGIARALAVDPELLIADEPVSALDVSVQVQILNLLKDIQKEMNLSYLFIAHDLAVVRYVSDRIIVMYLGNIVETSDANGLYEHPSHPYTEALLSAVPDVYKGLAARETGERSRIVLSGDVPSPTKVIEGCPFHPRCPRATERCRTEAPALREVHPGHSSACHYAEEVRAGTQTLEV